MKQKTRFIKSVIEASKSTDVVLPWARTPPQAGAA